MLRHLLLNPSGFLGGILREAVRALQAYGLPGAITALILITLLAVARAQASHRRHARMADGARQVTILAPPQASPEGGLVLWANLTGLLRPPWRRLLSGQPHLAWELRWTPDGARISLWLPGSPRQVWRPLCLRTASYLTRFQRLIVDFLALFRRHITAV
jgi:hypothetical protein